MSLLLDLLDSPCSWCGHKRIYHFDNGAGKVVCRAAHDCTCVRPQMPRSTPSEPKVANEAFQNGG